MLLATHLIAARLVAVRLVAVRLVAVRLVVVLTAALRKAHGLGLLPGSVFATNWLERH
jgi:hypothetical protein